jgi:hypothetical protein
MTFPPLDQDSEYSARARTNPLPVAVFRHRTPVRSLVHENDPSVTDSPYGSTLEPPTTVSPVHTNPAAPLTPTAMDPPQSNWHVAGIGGGTKSRWRMSQRAYSMVTAQPTLPEGIMN